MDCINGESSKKASSSMGYMETDSAHVAMGGGGASPRQESSLSLPVILWLTLTTLMSIVGLILGAWATWRSRSIYIPPYANIYTSAAQVPPGYTTFSLGSGTGFWAAERSMLHARSDHGVEAVDDIVYLIGGLSNDTFGNATVLSSTASYNTYTGYLKELLPMPEPRYRFASARIGNKIYVAGGDTVYDNNVDPVTPTAAALVYDIASNTWTALPPMSTARHDPAGAAYNGKFYAIGGYTNNYTEVLPSVEVYDPVTNKWSFLRTNMSVARGDARAATTSGLLHVVGGVGSDYGFLNSVEVYNDATGTWTAKAAMNNARGDFALAKLASDRLLVAGGETQVGSNTQFAQYAVEEYDPVQDIWVTKAPMPQANFRGAGAAVKNRFFLFGGQPTCSLNNLKDLVNTTDPKGNSSVACANLAFNNVVGYFDVVYPNLIVGVRPTATRRSSARRMGL